MAKDEHELKRSPELFSAISDPCSLDRLKPHQTHRLAGMHHVLLYHFLNRLGQFLALSNGINYKSKMILGSCYFPTYSAWLSKSHEAEVVASATYKTGSPNGRC